jgi:hypothetical protein
MQLNLSAILALLRNGCPNCSFIVAKTSENTIQTSKVPPKTSSMMAGAVILPGYDISPECLLAGLAEVIRERQAAIDECGNNERAKTVIASSEMVARGS